MKRACPNKSEILKIIKSNEFPIYIDQLGNYYGFLNRIFNIQSSVLIDKLIESGDVDQKSSFIMFVWLPFHTKNINSKSKETKNNLIGEEITFPEEGDLIKLTDIHDSKLKIDIQVGIYPQIYLRRKRRTDIFIARIF
jgi:hypothetical protein